MKGFSVLNPLFHQDGRPALNTDFAHYYQRIRSKQKREALLWSLGLVALYLIGVALCLVGAVLVAARH